MEMAVEDGPLDQVQPALTGQNGARRAGRPRRALRPDPHPVQLIFVIF